MLTVVLNKVSLFMATWVINNDTRRGLGGRQLQTAPTFHRPQHQKQRGHFQAKSLEVTSALSVTILSPLHHGCLMGSQSMLCPSHILEDSTHPQLPFPDILEHPKPHRPHTQLVHMYSTFSPFLPLITQLWGLTSSS